MLIVLTLFVFSLGKGAQRRLLLESNQSMDWAGGT